ncbi:hypothetical protein [Deinococcus hopiensis]|uniref:Uncharacterized protein n=1 Tax=Deinococcus hopiensis KR-140 TaxID=695939 RepID=A0A1W1VJA4_9DEIO|nr:hypothetical protein [Deinococcus hopiensis]SMB93310.1 hypothetical protein SAMN00790413_01929 [Deinococcus hopiensis KR-140]
MDSAKIRNPDTLNAANITTTGTQIFGVRPGDNKLFTDFNLIESVEYNRDEQKRTFKGNRKGLRKTYKEVIDESTFSLTFQTAGAGDVAIREWHVGKRAISTPATTANFTNNKAYVVGDLVTANSRVFRVTTAGTAGASAPTWSTTKGATVVSNTVVFTDMGTSTENSVLAFSNDSVITQGAFILVASTEESDNTISIVRAFPNGSIQGNGEPQVQEFDGLQFLMTAGANTGWTPPTSIGDFTTAKPDGVIYVVPAWRTEEIVNALAVSLSNFIGV